MARNLPRQGRSRRYGNVVPRSPAGPMDIGRSLRGLHPGPPRGGGRGFGPGKRGRVVQTPEGIKPFAPSGPGGFPRGPGKGMSSHVMAQIQFLRSAKNNLNVQHKQAMAANAAAGRPAGGKYTSGPLIGQPVPPNPTPGKIPSGPHAGEPTRTSVRMGARSRINAQLAQLRAEALKERALTTKHDRPDGIRNAKHDVERQADRMSRDAPSRGSRKHIRVYHAILRKQPRRPRGRKAYNTFT